MRRDQAQKLGIRIHQVHLLQKFTHTSALSDKFESEGCRVDMLHRNLTHESLKLDNFFRPSLNTGKLTLA